MPISYQKIKQNKIRTFHQINEASLPSIAPHPRAVARRVCYLSATLSPVFLDFAGHFRI